MKEEEEERTHNKQNQVRGLHIDCEGERKII